MATRKNYIEHIRQVAERTQNHLQKEYEDNLEKKREMDAMQKREQFNNLAGQLHHLVSTKTIPGVYNSPYAYTV